MKRIYLLYAQHIKAEFDRLRRSAEYSLTWAVEETIFLISALLPTREGWSGHSGQNEPLNVWALREALSVVPR